MGWDKPAAAIFDHAIERIAVSRDRVLHIGDNYDVDVLGARAAGLDAALVLRAADASSNSYRPTLRSLDEVIALQDERRPSTELRPNLSCLLTLAKSQQRDNQASVAPS